MTPAKSTADRIRDARNAARLTQRELADRLELRDALAVSRWERGRNLPSEAVRERLAAALGVTVEALFSVPSERTERAA